MGYLNSWLPIVAPAWVAGSLLALLSAPLGCLVLWRRMAFFAEALAHGTLLGVALAVWWQVPNGVGIAAVSTMVVLLMIFIDDERLPSDAILTTMAVSLLCAGLLTLTQLTQQQANILGYLFGNLLDIDWLQLPTIAIAVIISLGLLSIIWHDQVKLATHQALAQTQGIKPIQQQLFFMGLLAGFCVFALQAVGTLLINGLLVLPALSARLWASSPKMMLVFAVVIAQLSVTIGIWSSVWLDIQTGLSIVMILALTFFVSLIIKKWIR